jgi:hypothetical protein
MLPAAWWWWTAEAGPWPRTRASSSRQAVPWHGGSRPVRAEGTGSGAPPAWRSLVITDREPPSARRTDPHALMQAAHCFCRYARAISDTSKRRRPLG